MTLDSCCKQTPHRLYFVQSRWKQRKCLRSNLLFQAEQVCGGNHRIVTDTNTGNLMPGATVKLLDMGMNVIAEQIVQQDARYSFPEEVECGQAYYLVTENGLAYSIAETTFVAPATSQTVSVDMAIETFSQDCPPYDLGCLLGLNPIYFDLNKYYIRPDAEIELTKVYNAMIRFPEMIIRIESHTDSRSHSPITYAFLKIVHINQKLADSAWHCPFTIVCSGLWRKSAHQSLCRWGSLFRSRASAQSQIDVFNRELSVCCRGVRHPHLIAQHNPRPQWLDLS